MAADAPRSYFNRRLLIHCFYLENMIYPLSSLGALLFWAMALMYLVLNASPVHPQLMPIFVLLWLPLLFLKFICTMKAYPYVAVFTIWRSQQAWFAYSLAILRATSRAILGFVFPCFKTGWFNTGSKRKRTQL